MKKIIYYFSGTGNNVAVAKGLCEQIPEMEMRPITSLLDNKTIGKEYDMVGFTVPSYYSHIPPIVMDCMKNLQFLEHQKIFSIIGCGGNRGHATEDIRQLVEASGKTVNYEYMVVFPGNYILSYGAFPKWYQRPVLRHSKKKIKAIAMQLSEAGSDKQLGKGLFYREKYEAALQKSISKYSEKGLEYTANNQCINCGQCVQVCPANNITMENGKVTFGGNCNQCMDAFNGARKKQLIIKTFQKTEPDIITQI